MKQANRKNQKGSALLLTLGILSLVLILGMSFAFTARTNLQISKVNADQIQARLFAESCLERVIANLNYAMRQESVNLHSLTNDYFLSTRNNDKAGFDSTNKYIENAHYKQFYATIGADKSDESDNSLAKTIINNSRVAKFINDACQSSAEKTFEKIDGGFQTITYGNTPSTVRATGRIGFIMLDETGKVDINRLIPLRKSKNLPFVQYDSTAISPIPKQKERDNGILTLNFSADSDFYYPLLDTYTPTAKVDYNNTIRLGQHPMEIWTDNKYITNLYDGYETITRTQWFSYSHLMDTISGFSDDYFKYTFFSQQEPEQYRLGVAGDAIIYNRFDLTGYEQGERTAGSFYDAANKPSSANKSCYWKTNDRDEAKDIIDTLCSVPSVTTSNNVQPIDDSPQKSIPWLTLMKDKDGNEIGKHIAANMIDFCDEDDYATIDSNFKNNFANLNFNNSDDLKEPEYCGNEKVPYINEIYIPFDIILEPAGAQFNFKVLYSTPELEYVNYFDEKLSLDGVTTRLKFIGKIEAQCDNTSHATLPLPSSANKHTWISTSTEEASLTNNISIEPTSFEHITLTPSTSQLLSFDEPGISVVDPGTGVTTYKNPVINFTFTINKIIAISEKDNKILDVAYIEPETPLERTYPVDQTTIGQTISFCVSAQCLDARVNHRSISWVFAKQDPSNHDDNKIIKDEGGTYTSFGTFVSSTDIKDEFGSDYVYDHYDDFTELAACCYIKNAPFENFWELGSISRGEPGRTINLALYDSYSTDNRTYDKGDAGILDQIKIGPAKYAYKININGQYKMPDTILRNELLANIVHTDGYDAPTKPASSTVFPADRTLGLDDLTFKKYASRAMILANAIQSPPDNVSDRERESFIGRSANLFSTRYEYFTIFIVGQALEQLDEVTDSNYDDVKDLLVKPTKYTYKYRTSDGSSREEATKYCSIRATQLMEVNLMRDAWLNKITILNKRYIE